MRTGNRYLLAVLVCLVGALPGLAQDDPSQPPPPPSDPTPTPPAPGPTPSPPTATPAPPDSPAPPNAPLPQDLLRFDGFRLHETEHFAITTDTETKILRSVIGRLENVYRSVRRFCDATHLPTDTAPPGRLGVVFFDSFEDYARFAAACGEDATVTAGFYHWASGVAVFYNTFNRPDVRRLTDQIDSVQEQIRQLRRPGAGRVSSAAYVLRLQRQVSGWRIQRDAFVKQANRVVLQHEIAHQILFHFAVHARFVHNPTWLVEGLACQFEIAQMPGSTGIGRLNRARFDDFRSAFPAPGRNNRLAPERLQAPFQQGKLIPLRDLIAHPNLLADRSAPNILQRYAESWALVYYLHREHSEALTRYLVSVAKRPRGKVLTPAEELAAFETAFGPLDDAFQKRWVTWILQRRPNTGS